MKYLKNEDGTVILKFNEETGLAVFTHLNESNEASTGIDVSKQTIEKAPDEMVEIEEGEYMTIRNGKMADYWNATAS